MTMLIKHTSTVHLTFTMLQYCVLQYDLAQKNVILVDNTSAHSFTVGLGSGYLFTYITAFQMSEGLKIISHNALQCLRMTTQNITKLSFTFYACAKLNILLVCLIDILIVLIVSSFINFSSINYTLHSIHAVVACKSSAFLLLRATLHPRASCTKACVEFKLKKKKNFVQQDF